MRRLKILCRHEMRRATKTWVSRLVFAAMPLVLAAFLRETFAAAVAVSGGGDVDGSQHAIPGMALLFAFVALVYFGYTAFDDFGSGMWDRLRVAHVGSAETLSAKAIAMAAHLVIHFAVVMVVGAVFLGFEVRGSWWELGVVVVAVCTVCVAYAFMAFAFSRSNAVYNAFCYVGAMALSALGGGLVPFGLLPGWAQSVGRWTPTYWSMSGLELVVDGRGDAADVARHLAVLGGFVTAFVVVGVVRYDADTDREAFSM